MLHNSTRTSALPGKSGKDRMAANNSAMSFVGTSQSTKNVNKKDTLKKY